MIRPTQRAVVLATLGVAFALVPSFVGSSFWTIYVAFALAFVAVLGLEFLASPAHRDISVAVDYPTQLYVGDRDPLPVKLIRARAGRSISVTLRLDTDDRLEAIAAHQTALRDSSEVVVPLVPRRRGTTRIGSLWLKWRGPLGLLERISERPLDHELDILPNVRAVRTTALEIYQQRELMIGLKTERYVGDGSEFDALREFSPGLDHRTIDWKASARHLKLLCRQFRAERNHQVVIAFDTGRLMREPIEGLAKLDHAINAGLLLAYVSLRTGDRVGIYGFDAQPGAFVQPTAGVGSVHRLQHAASRLEYSEHETNYTLGLTELSSRLRRRSLIILMTDFTDTTTAELLLDNLQRLSRKHLLVFVSLKDPTLHAQIDRDPETIVDLHEVVVARELIRDREVVLRRLSRMGAHCVDTTAQAFSASLLNTYIDIRRRELIG